MCLFWNPYHFLNIKVDVSNEYLPVLKNIVSYRKVALQLYCMYEYISNTNSTTSIRLCTLNKQIRIWIDASFEVNFAWSKFCDMNKREYYLYSLYCIKIVNNVLCFWLKVLFNQCVFLGFLCGPVWLFTGQPQVKH